jgi:hypothetical protein
LEFKPANPKQPAGCPAIIEYWNGPAGLSIETRHNLELRYFHKVTAEAVMIILQSATQFVAL